MNRSKSGWGASVPRGPIQLMYRLYRYILPEVRSELRHWRGHAEQIPDPELRKQAIASMTSKQFHCEGGSVYAAMDMPQRHVIVPLIVALQTISDYLDNLCDRSTSMDGDDFRQLHLAMLDAVQPAEAIHHYYALHQEQEDGGYLRELVEACRRCIRQLPSYHLVEQQVVELVSYYCDLQVHKHIRHDLREPELLSWWEEHRDRYPGLRWNEFAAASGSTLAVFMLFTAAANPSLDSISVDSIRSAYFPHVCSLHILLDYLIDQEEDRRGGDLNFCNYYESMETTVERIESIAEQARNDIRKLQHPPFHRMIIEGLLAVYLSDPKVRTQHQVKQISRRLMKQSPWIRLFFWVNSMWVRKKI